MPDANLTLSVVVPVYNGIQYLHGTLASLEEIEKTVSCEILFQNCLSTDGTTEILDGFCQQRANRFHYNEADSGQSDAINRGVEKARGKWVTWLCADDMLLPQLAQALAEAEKADVDILYGDIVFIENNTCFPAIGTENHAPGALARRRLIIQQPGTCILRAVWQEAGGVRSDLNWSMDYDLFLRLESAGKRFLRTCHFVAVIRVHKDAKTSSGSVKRMLELWRVIVQSHRRRPVYFRTRPYIVYGIEYIIKALQARKMPSDENLGAGILLRILHRIFWLIASPREKNNIEQRFQTLPEYYCKRFLVQKRGQGDTL